MNQPLLRSVEDGVALLTFNREEFANSWAADLHVAYIDALREFAADEAVRAVVVTGKGRYFCAGADMSLLDDLLEGRTLPPELRTENVLEPLRFPKPLIAAINGPAAGMGLIQALVCDVRFAAADAVVTTSFTHRGLAAEHGISWLLPQIVGRAVSLDLLLSSRRVGAEEAQRLGLVNRVVEPGEVVSAALEYARQIARDCSPAAMAVIKQQVNRHAVMPYCDAEEETLPLVDQGVKGPDFIEGVRSFIERRPAGFAPLGAGTVFPEVGTVRRRPGDVG